MAVQRIGPPDEMLWAQTIAFSADSALIVVSGHTTIPHDASKIEVFERNGDKTSCFTDPLCTYVPFLALLKGSRSAIAHSKDFSVWDLPTGKLLGTVCPELPVQAHPQHECAAIVITGPGGAKLAFKATNSFAMLLYDATTLCMLGVVSPFPRIHACVTHETVVWGAFSWLIWQKRMLLFCQDQEADVSIVKAVKHQASSSLSLQSAAQMRASDCRYALSPDGAFVCMVTQDAQGLAIIDTRTGQVTASIACSKHVDHISWSSCGRWITMGTSWRAGRTSRAPGRFTSRFPARSTDRLSFVLI